MPDNAITQPQIMTLEDVVVKNIQREYLAIFDKIPDLPAYAAVIPQNPVKLSDDFGLSFQIMLDGRARLVAFPQIIWRRRNHQRNRPVRNLAEKITHMAFVQDDFGIRFINHFNWFTAVPQRQIIHTCVPVLSRKYCPIKTL